MSNWWYVLAIVAIAALGILYLRYRRRSSGQITLDRRNSADPNRDFAQERETSRTSHMSEEDRTWEADSLQRNRQEPAESPPQQPARDTTASGQPPA